jgi:hypothetical protein
MNNNNSRTVIVAGLELAGVQAEFCLVILFTSNENVNVLTKPAYIVIRGLFGK